LPSSADRRRSIARMTLTSSQRVGRFRRKLSLIADRLDRAFGAFQLAAWHRHSSDVSIKESQGFCSGDPIPIAGPAAYGLTEAAGAMALEPRGTAAIVIVNQWTRARRHCQDILLSQ
jgi:hypothetical protein